MIKKMFVGIKGFAVCIDKKTGTEIWRTKLKADWGKITNIYCDNEKVFVYVHGHLFCLNVDDGKIEWENKLEGLGHGACIIASELQGAGAIASQQASAATTAAELIFEGIDGVSGSS